MNNKILRTLFLLVCVSFFLGCAHYRVADDMVLVSVESYNHAGLDCERAFDDGLVVTIRTSENIAKIAKDHNYAIAPMGMIEGRIEPDPRLVSWVVCCNGANFFDSAWQRGVEIPSIGGYYYYKFQIRIIGDQVVEVPLSDPVRYYEPYNLRKDKKGIVIWIRGGGMLNGTLTTRRVLVPSEAIIMAIGDEKKMNPQANHSR